MLHLLLKQMLKSGKNGVAPFICYVSTGFTTCDPRVKPNSPAGYIFIFLQNSKMDRQRLTIIL